MYKPPYVKPPLFLSKQAKIFWEKSIKEGGLGKQNMQASNVFGKEGVYNFPFIKGKFRHVFSARG